MLVAARVRENPRNLLKEIGCGGLQRSEGTAAALQTGVSTLAAPFVILAIGMNDLTMTEVWVFSGAKRHFPGGVFTSREIAEPWILKNRLTGTLTLYPVDVGAYERAIDKGLFRPKKPHESEPEFIGGFSDAGMEHYHYENGERQSGW